MRRMRDEIVDMIHTTIGGGNVYPMVKRIVEFEMNHQLSKPFYHKLSDELKKEVVFRSIVEASEVSDKNVQQQVIEEYKGRGVVSIFNPHGMIETKTTKPIQVDPLLVPLKNRLDKFRQTGALLVSRRPSAFQRSSYA
jgi:hypothetical protein